MGRILKNAPFSSEKYLVAPPAAPVAGNGKSHGYDELEFGDVDALGELPAPEPAATVQTIDSRTDSETIDWAELHHQTTELVEAAAVEGEAILREAHDRATAILESARRSAGDVTTQAQESGHQAGYAAGTEAAQAEMDTMLSTMRGLIDMARVERHKIIESAESEIVRLSMGIAEQVIHRQVDFDRNVVVGMVKSAIDKLIDRESITVRVNPIDLARMQQHRDEILALGETKHVRLIEDRRIGPGGVVVETESGTLDGRIETQIDEAKRVLGLAEQQVVVEPAADSPLRPAVSS